MLIVSDGELLGYPCLCCFELALCYKDKYFGGDCFFHAKAPRPFAHDVIECGLLNVK